MATGGTETGSFSGDTLAGPGTPSGAGGMMTGPEPSLPNRGTASAKGGEEAAS
jgi:hypothetical protein